MKVALTVWEDRISPVFDAASKLLIAEIRQGEIIGRQYQSFVPEVSTRLAMILETLGVDVIICGAISRFSSVFIESSHIRLIPFVSGNVEEVLAAYAAGNEIVPAFLMPGCGGRHGQNKNPNKMFNQKKEVMGMPKGDGTGPRGDGGGAGRGRGGCKSSNAGKTPGTPGTPGQGRGSGQGRRGGKGRGSRK